MSEEKKFRVLVCGGRNYLKHWNVRTALKYLMRIHGPLVVIEGGAQGADFAARIWAEDHAYQGVEHLSFEANWPYYGGSAGPIRNGEMLREGNPDLIVAFPGNRGTRNMVQQARQAGVKVIYGEDLISEGPQYAP